MGVWLGRVGELTKAWPDGLRIGIGRRMAEGAVQAIGQRLGPDGSAAARACIVRPRTDNHRFALMERVSGQPRIFGGPVAADAGMPSRRTPHARPRPASADRCGNGPRSRREL